MRDLAVLQQQSRQSINFCDHHCGRVPLSGRLSRPHPLKSNSVVQSPRILTAGSALCPDRPLDPADLNTAAHLYSILDN